MMNLMESRQVRWALGSLKWDLFTRWTGAEAGEGCCTCGGPTWHYAYWDACDPQPSKDAARPDWFQCKWCHDDPANASMMELRWEAQA